MQLRIFTIAEFLGVIERTQGFVFQCKGWPAGLLPGDVMTALCGPSDEAGWYPYWEPDVRWIVGFLEIASQMSREQIGMLGIIDSLNLSATPACLSKMAFGRVEPTVSQIAAATFVSRAFQRCFRATEEEAADLVRMNLFAERVAV